MCASWCVLQELRRPNRKQNIGANRTQRGRKIECSTHTSRAQTATNETLTTDPCISRNTNSCLGSAPNLHNNNGAKTADNCSPSVTPASLSAMSTPRKSSIYLGEPLRRSKGSPAVEVRDDGGVQGFLVQGGRSSDAFHVAPELLDIGWV